MRLRVIGLVLALATASAAPLDAAETVEVRYDVFWGGFRAAEARLVSAGGDAQLAVRATGLVDSLSAFALEAEAHPERFRTHSRSKRMESLLAVDYHGTPRTVIDEIRRAEPEDEDEPRPPVPEQLKAGTFDPLTALTTACRRALTARAGERFVLPVYDGRNRYDVVVAVSGTGSADVAGRRVVGPRATVEFHPVAGFRKKSQEMWTGATFTVLVDPATQLPARIASETFTVATVISAVPMTQKAGG